MKLPSLVLALATGAGVAQAPQTAEPPVEDEIVVTGIRGDGRPRVEPDAVDVLRTFCFDPARLTGRLVSPSPKARWSELDEQARRRFHIDDPAVPAYALDDEIRGQQLWLKLEEFSRPKDLSEQRCTLLVIGGRNHKRFVDDMSKLFRGNPTQRHVGAPDGLPAIAGWEQWLWTGMPPRRSKSWTSINQLGGASSGWLVVVKVRGFYREYDYITGDMKLRKKPGVPVTMLTFAVTTMRRTQESIPEA